MSNSTSFPAKASALLRSSPRQPVPSKYPCQLHGLRHTIYERSRPSALMRFFQAPNCELCCKEGLDHEQKCL